MLNMLKLNKSMTQQIRAKNDGTLTHCDSRAEVFVKSELRVRLLECFSFLLQFPAFPPSTTENFNTRRITWKLNPWSIFPENKLNRLRKFKKTREKDNDL